MGLPRRVISAYALISFGLAGTLVLTGVYLPRLYVDHAGLPMSKLAVMIPCMQFLDAVTELPTGTLSDQSISARGRRRPFVLGGSVLLAVATIGVSFPPRRVSKDGIAAYVFTMMSALVFSSTLVRVPWMAWGAELTSDYHEKTVVVAYREGVWFGGTLASAVASVAAGAFVAGMFERLLIAAVFWASALLAAGVIAYVQVPDPQPMPTSKARSESSSTMSGFSMHFGRNRLALVLLAAHVSLTVGWAINFFLYAFYVPYVIEVEVTDWIIGLFVISAAVGVGGTQQLSNRLEKKPMLVGAIVLQALSSTVSFLAVGSGDVAVYLACMTVAGFGFGGTSVMVYSVMGDVLDVQQLISGGRRDEAKMYGLFDITRKIAASTGLAICYAAIDSTGYQPDVKPQTRQTKLAIRVSYALVPAVLMWVAAAIVVCLYSLNQKSHAEVLARLVALAQGGPTEIRDKTEGDQSPGEANAVSQVVGVREAEL